MIRSAVAPLFVPATRPERIAKAMAAGTDAVILDLEDAVAPADKATARAALSHLEPMLAAVRINGRQTEWFDDDIAACAAAGVPALIVPKADSAVGLREVAERMPMGTVIVALVETILGVERVFEIAGASDRMAFGSLDYAHNLGCAPDYEPLLYARTRIASAAVLAGQPAPLDGVTANFRDEDICGRDTAHALKMGFGGRLCIHPSQVALVFEGFAPSAAELAWARKVEAVGPGVHNVDGVMVDGPVFQRARAVLARHAATSGHVSATAFQQI